MANAGRVALVPKGDYNSATSYKKLDVVRYNNDLYVAKKANTGVLPTETATWMLCMENVTQSQYDDLISGTTPAGNSTLHSGFTAQQVGESGARNLIPYPYYNTTKTNSGITWTDNGDGTVTANGTATEHSYFHMMYRGQNIDISRFKGQDVILSGGKSGSVYAQISFRDSELNNMLTLTDIGNSPTGTVPDATVCADMILVVTTGTTVTNEVFEPMLELGSIAHDYVPYHFGGAEDAAKLNGLTAEEFVSNGNMAINTNFLSPVNSSGATSWTAGYKEIIDDWYIATTSASVELTEDGLAVTYLNTTYGSAIYQRLSYALDYLAGRTFAISAKVDGVVYSGKVTLPSTLDGVTLDSTNVSCGTGTYLDFYKGASDTQLQFRLVMGEAKTTTIEWVKLEPGAVATPYVPPNKEVEKLKCGATVGDAESVNGFKIYTEVTDFGCTLASTATEIWQALPLGSKLLISAYSLTDSSWNFPYTVGTLEIVKFTNMRGYLELNSIEGKCQRMGLANNAPTGTWVNIADGGNADTVDGYHVSKLLKANAVGTPTDFLSSQMWRNVSGDTRFPSNYGMYVGFSSNTDGNTAKYMLHLYYSGGYLYTQFTSDNNEITADGWNKLSRVSDLANYLPLDGSVPMSGAMRFGGGYGRINAEGFYTSLMSNEVQSGTDFTNCRYLQISNKKHGAFPQIQKALQLRDVTDGVETQYTVLHTGNSMAVQKGTTAPSDTSALWVDTTNKVIKAYIDGAWTQVS